LIRHRARTSNNDSPRAKSASAQIFSRIEISRGFRASSWLFCRLVHRGARLDESLQKKNQPGAARAFVADRSSFAICTTTQHSNHSNRSNTTQHNTRSKRRKNRFLTRVSHP
jgi:hypothetical protein